MRVCLDTTSFLSTMTITMDVVRLSSVADKKKVTIITLHSRACLLRVANFCLTKLKPPLLSTTSTMVIAPSRKKSISLVSPTCSTKREFITAFLKSSNATPSGVYPDNPHV